MATYEGLKNFIKGVKDHTKMNVGGKEMVGKRLKSFLISKLNTPEVIDIDDKPTTTKQKPSKSETIKTE